MDDRSDLEKWYSQKKWYLDIDSQVYDYILIDLKKTFGKSFTNIYWDDKKNVAKLKDYCMDDLIRKSDPADQDKQKYTKLVIHIPTITRTITIDKGGVVRFEKLNPAREIKYGPDTKYEKMSISELYFKAGLDRFELFEIIDHPSRINDDSVKTPLLKYASNIFNKR